MTFVYSFLAFVIDLLVSCSLFLWFGALALLFFLILSCLDLLGV